MDPTLCDTDMEQFTDELAALINRHNLDSLGNVPDYILADYLVDCLGTFIGAHVRTNHWLGVKTG